MSDLTQLSRRTFMVMPLVLAACKPGRNILELSGATMGTTYNVTAVDPTGRLARADVEQAISQALADVNRSMSNWDATSEISQFNAQGSTAAKPMSRDLATVMQAAEQVNRDSDGRFDTTIGPLIELWGFGAKGAQTMPGDAQIAQALAASGQGNTLSIGAGQMQKKAADTQVYLAAIGKGYGADHVGRALEAQGISDYLVEIGGDLYASGRNPDGQPWQIGIETPNAADRQLFDVIGVSGMGLASSGDYRNYFEKDGERYSHVIDPVTGRPITHKTASATVLADNAMLADAWATAMLVLGRERGLEVAAQHDIAVSFIERDPNATTLQFKSQSSAAFDRLTA